MPREINGQKYYGTLESCEKIGINRPTLFRWLKAGILEKKRKDRRDWRVFTEEDLANIKEEAIATSVRISLKKKIDKLYIKVTDNGNETTPAQILDHLPFRLIEIFERAHLFGIEIKTRGKINGGNTITLSIPLN